MKRLFDRQFLADAVRFGRERYADRFENDYDRIFDKYVDKHFVQWDNISRSVPHDGLYSPVVFCMLAEELGIKCNYPTRILNSLFQQIHALKKDEFLHRQLFAKTKKEIKMLIASCQNFLRSQITKIKTREGKYIDCLINGEPYTFLYRDDDDVVDCNDYNPDGSLKINEPTYYFFKT